MKKTGLILLLLILWLLTSSREFYLHYSIQKIKQQQQDHITHLKETSVLKTLIVALDDPFLELEGSKELFYQDTLYDIISAEDITPTHKKYLLLPDHLEQNLWSMLFETRKPLNHENCIITFYYKFIAIQSDDLCLLHTPFIQHFLIIPFSKQVFALRVFTERLLQPPD